MKKSRPPWINPYLTTPPNRKFDPIKIEVAIIGGGITGISAAYHLSKKGISCILMEDKMIAHGASGKNVGTVVPGTEHDFIEAVGKFGYKKAKRIWQASIYSLKSIKDTVRKEKINCDFKNVGHLNVATNEKELTSLKREYTALKSAGFKTRWLNERKARNKVRSPLILGAERSDYDFTLFHPDFVRGLARKAASRGVLILENSKAHPVKSATGWIIKAPLGLVYADKLILATETRTPVEFLPLKLNIRQDVGMATDPMPTSWFENHWKGNEIFWNFGVHYHMFRKWNKRILYTSFARKETTPHIFSEFFPNIRFHIKRPHKWPCYVGEFEDQLPRIGKVPGHKNLYFSGGYRGHGISLGFLGGKILTDLIGGRKNKYNDLFKF